MGFIIIIGVIIIAVIMGLLSFVRKRNLQKIICANVNCGYKGEPKMKSRGNLFVGLILCCFFLLPGIIYFMFKGGYRYSCPDCGTQIANDN
jgi:hypothetical protein